MGQDQEDAGSALGDLAAEVEQPSEEMREIFGLGFPAAEHFAQMLVAEGELRGLLGPRELPEALVPPPRQLRRCRPLPPLSGDRGRRRIRCGFPWDHHRDHPTRFRSISY